MQIFTNKDLGKCRFDENDGSTKMNKLKQMPLTIVQDEECVSSYKIMDGHLYIYMMKLKSAIVKDGS